MSEMSRNARRAMRAKIHRITAANNGKVDASDYGPEEVLNSEVKTGMRPISRRAYKKGGKVVAVAGADAKQNAGKKPRAGKKHLTVDALVNRNLKDANEAREGKKHVGALKTGGRAMKKGGGGVPDVYTSSRPTDSSGRPVSNKELDMGYAKDTPKRTMANSTGPSPVAVSKVLAGMRNNRKDGGANRAMKDSEQKNYGGQQAIPQGMQRAMQQQQPAMPRNPAIERLGYDQQKPMPYKRGGNAWEGSAKDESQDKKLAKKYGMSMAAWEKSKMDKKHDTQHSAKGLNKGGRTGKSLGGVLKDVAKYGALGIAGNEIVKNPSLLMGGLGALAYKAFGKKKDGPSTESSVPVAGKKRGGRLTSLDGEMQTQEKVGGRIAKQYGGGLGALEMNKGGRAKKNGKTDINITIVTGKGQPQMDPNAPPPMPQGVPVQMPPPPQPQAGPPMQMPMPPMPAPPMGGPGAGPQPMPRKAGGRTYRSYKDMDAGAGSGLGRSEKTEIQKRKK
jgi:hypothetical protein